VGIAEAMEVRKQRDVWWAAGRGGSRVEGRGSRVEGQRLHCWLRGRIIGWVAGVELCSVGCVFTLGKVVEVVKVPGLGRVG
jgi:hypothetical protein